jgi:hypothetical protein
VKAKDVEKWGLSHRRATYLCALLYLPAPGRGHARTLTEEDLRLLVVTDTLLDTFQQRAAIDMALKLRARCPDLSGVGWVYWVGQEHRCTLTQPHNHAIAFALNIRNILRQRKKTP